MNRTIITIMADYGSAPYAWEKDASDSSNYVGRNIADCACGFPEDYGVSKSLEKDLANWACDFENEVDCINPEKTPTSWWDSWNQRGLELTKRLKAEIGDRFDVSYSYPCEDPNAKPSVCF